MDTTVLEDIAVTAATPLSLDIASARIRQTLLRTGSGALALHPVMSSREDGRVTLTTRFHVRPGAYVYEVTYENLPKSRGTVWVCATDTERDLVREMIGTYTLEGTCMGTSYTSDPTNVSVNMWPAVAVRTGGAVDVLRCRLRSTFHVDEVTYGKDALENMTVARAFVESAKKKARLTLKRRGETTTVSLASPGDGRGITITRVVPPSAGLLAECVVRYQTESKDNYAVGYSLAYGAATVGSGTIYVNRTLVVRCTDSTAEAPAKAYMMRRGIGEYDTLTVPGASFGCLDEDGKLAPGVRDSIAASYNAHGFTRVIVLDHAPCDLWRVVSSDHSDTETAEHTAQHFGEMTSAVAAIHDAFPYIDVEGYLLHPDGTPTEERLERDNAAIRAADAKATATIIRGSTFPATARAPPAVPVSTATYSSSHPPKSFGSGMMTHMSLNQGKQSITGGTREVTVDIILNVPNGNLWKQDGEPKQEVIYYPHVSATKVPNNLPYDVDQRDYPWAIVWALFESPISHSIRVGDAVMLTIIQPEHTNLFTESVDALSFVPGGFFGYNDTHKKYGITLPLMMKVTIKGVRTLEYEKGLLPHDATRDKWRDIRPTDRKPPIVRIPFGSGGD